MPQVVLGCLFAAASQNAKVLIAKPSPAVTGVLKALGMETNLSPAQETQLFGTFNFASSSAPLDGQDQGVACNQPPKRAKSGEQHPQAPCTPTPTCVILIPSKDHLPGVLDALKTRQPNIKAAAILIPTEANALQVHHINGELSLSNSDTIIPLVHSSNTTTARDAVGAFREAITARDERACEPYAAIAQVILKVASHADSSTQSPAQLPALCSVETFIDKLIAFTRRFSAQQALPSTTTTTSGRSQGEDILTVISRQRLVDVEKAQESVSLQALKQRLRAAPALIDFPARLLLGQPMAVMAEVKRASPSRGDIAPDMKADEQALRYARGGAAGISVLTEPTWFKGTLDDLLAARLAVDGMPTRPAFLRKDFILDEYQVTAKANKGRSKAREKESHQQNEKESYDPQIQTQTQTQTHAHA